MRGNVYTLYAPAMLSVSSSQFRRRQSAVIAAAEHEPVEIRDDTERLAVVVSSEFYDRAVEALEDQAAVRCAADARQQNRSRAAHEELKGERGAGEPTPADGDRAFLELANKVLAKAQAVARDPKRRRPRLR